MDGTWNLKSTNVMLKRICLFQGVGRVWGRYLMSIYSIWGKLVIFDIFLTLSYSLASHIISFVETNRRPTSISLILNHKVTKSPE